MGAHPLWEGWGRGLRWVREGRGESPQPWGSRSCCHPCCPCVPVVPQAPIHNRPQILWLQEGFPLLSSQGDPGTSPIAGDSPHGGFAWGGVSVPVSPWMPSARLSPCTSRPTDILTPFYRPHWSCMGQNPSKTGLCTHGVPMGQQYWHWGGSHQGTVPALLVLMVPPAQRSQLHSPESQLPSCCSVALNQSQPPHTAPHALCGAGGSRRHQQMLSSLGHMAPAGRPGTRWLQEWGCEDGLSTPNSCLPPPPSPQPPSL